MNIRRLLANLFRMGYNKGTIGKEVPAVEEKTEERTNEPRKTLSDYGLGVLYYKCKKINHNLITSLLRYPELIERIKSDNRNYTDEIICNIITSYYYDVKSSGDRKPSLARYARKVNIAVYGEVPNDIDDTTRQQQYQSPPSDLAYLADVLDGMRKTPKSNLFQDDAFVKKARAAFPITSPEQAYHIYFSIFATKVRSGIKQSDPEEFSKMRVIVKDFCRILYNDLNHWHADYAAFWSGK